MDKKGGRGGGRREYHNIVENFLSHSAGKFRRGTLLCCFRKFLVAKKFMDKKGGVTKFSVENFLSHSAEKFRRGTLLCCFRKFLVAKKFMDKKGGVTKFSIENFLSHSAEKFRRGTLLCCVSENFW